MGRIFYSFDERLFWPHPRKYWRLACIWWFCDKISGAVEVGSLYCLLRQILMVSAVWIVILVRVSWYILNLQMLSHVPVARQWGRASDEMGVNIEDTTWLSQGELIVRIIFAFQRRGFSCWFRHDEWCFLKPIIKSYPPLARSRAHDNKSITINHPADKT